VNDTRAKIQELLAAHETWRGRTLNLIASENVLSPAVRAALNNDLLQRYADYSGRDLSARRYQGNRMIELIETEVAAIARRVLRAREIELRPISGHVAGAAVLLGLCRPGDTILEPGRDSGGHREGGKLVSGTAIPLKVQYLPVDPGRYNIDVAAAVRLVAQVRPRAVILGSSNFLFPHPVAALKAALKDFPETVLVYDASHVMGLIASGRFQDPLVEGADIVFGSTHKTLPGPQGGIIYSNRADLMERVCAALYPALVTNHHPFRLPALGYALLELETWGGAYANQVIANAQALGSALEAQGIPCVRVDGRFSCSHTLLACVADFGKAAVVAQRLEEAGVITTAAHLPELWGVEGLRIGVQEITRRGAKEGDMQRVGRWIAQAVRAEVPAVQTSGEVAEFVTTLGPLAYTWPADAP
jgi:glycine hydroxymethyltransferase